MLIINNIKWIMCNMMQKKKDKYGSEYTTKGLMRISCTNLKQDCYHHVGKCKIQYI